MLLKSLNKFYQKSLLVQNKRFITQLADQTFLNEDQIAFQQVALDFAKNKIAPFAEEWDRTQHFPKDVLREAAELGFGGIYHSADYGGCDLGRLTASVVFEALATACVSTSAFLTIENMNCWLVDQFASKEQKDLYLSKMISLEFFSSYCLTEPNSGSDAQSMKTQAKEVGDDFVINGSKCFISGGGQSDIYLLMCLTGENEKSCIIVPKDAKGLSFGAPEKKMGWKNSPTTVVTFDDVKVPKSNLLGKRGDGFKMAIKALDGGRINIASTSLGAGAYAVQKTNRYLSERKQFGKQLNQFQYLQFKLAEMNTDLIASRVLVRTAAQKIDNDDPEKTAYCSMAKYFATEKCYSIVDQALQLHGGYGYIAEGGIERYLRDIRVNRILEGTNEIMKLIISRKILSEVN